ncbi:sugar ABC transporter substrate-binding protein [Pseudomonas protegens]|uniref:Sugar ABC transporter substrate-binding protein n=1 Tax=Pseudomonas protegens TaxID=380021 RepID=A0A2T6GGA2_9PSED|nr:FecR domain-containing protein [Pseudomonas protegens]PUA43174.1 sugar ABC transporter substrate-binding protein [Pseudomonas protegens]
MTSSTGSDPRQVARAAARWLALLESGSASESDQQGLQQWRERCASHEQAWQKAQLLRQRFAELPPALALASLDRPQVGRRALLKRGLGVALLVPSAWWLSRQLPLEAWRADLHTATGERKQLSLADGSFLQLNTATALDLDLAARRLTLVQGEIALRVPGHSALTLYTDFGRVRVSQSEVCVRQERLGCRVSVVSGVVQVQPLQGPALTLHGGQQVSLQASGAGLPQVFDSAIPGWREGVLLAQDQPLGDFLRELSRYRRGVLRWDPELEALRVTGSFRVEDTDRVLALLAASLPLEVQARTRFWVTLRSRKKLA